MHRRVVSVVLLTIFLAAPAAFAAPRGDDPGAGMIAKIIRVVHHLFSFAPNDEMTQPHP